MSYGHWSLVRLIVKEYLLAILTFDMTCYNGKSLFPNPVDLGYVAAEGSFTFEGLFTMTTVVAKMPRKVGIFDVIPQIVQMRVFFSTEGALKAWLPILES